MPDKNEIERRKQITRALKLQQQQQFEAGLPTTRETFRELFDYLDEQLSQWDCDHSLKMSIHFLQSRQLGNVEVIAEWLRENGGHCDCEVLDNVVEKFGDL